MMEKKVRIDLSSPPPVPDAEPPVPPELVDPPVIPEGEPVNEGGKTKEPVKRRSMMPAILAVAAVAAVLLCGYRFVHFWSEATCQQKARCSICGAEKDGYADHSWLSSGSCSEPAVCTVCGQKSEAASHDWTGGSCTEARTCTVCGAVEDRAPGHSWQDGVCTVCGAEQTNEVLAWVVYAGHELTYEWLPEDHAIVLSDSSLKNFSRMDIIFRDYRNDAVSADRYTVERSDETVKVNLPRDLAPGWYTVHAGVQETGVAEFAYGTGDMWLPEKADEWLVDFVVFNAAHGHYLAEVQEGDPLQGVHTAEEATRFDSPWRMSCVGGTADFTAVLTQGGTDAKFVADRYTGPEGNAYVFRFNSWYLTMNADGQVSLTDTLDEGCFWIVDSGLQ